MKKELLVLLMIVSSALILSAEGKQDDTDGQFYGRGHGMMDGYRSDGADKEEWLEQREAARNEYLEGLETISLTGALTLVNGEMPTIESEATKYYIMAPWFAASDLELTNGMVVTVEGYEMPRRPMQWDDSEKSIMVTKAVINGEEFEIDHDAAGYGMMGGYGGRCGAGGPGRNGGPQGGGMMGKRN